MFSLGFLALTTFSYATNCVIVNGICNVTINVETRLISFGR